MKNEKRKLQELGGSLYLSLPSTWINKFQLRKGSEIVLSTTESGELQLFPEEQEEEQERSVIIEYDTFLFRNLLRDYLRGADTIKIFKKIPFSKREREIVANCINHLLGAEIIEEDASSISLHCLKSDVPLKKLVARMYYLTRSMMDDLNKGLNNIEILSGIIERDQLVGKFYFALIMRQRSLLTKKWSREVSFTEILDLRLLIERIELIGDELKRIAKIFLEKKKKINIKPVDLQHLLEKYQQAYEAYVKQDVETAKQFWITESSDRQTFSHNEHLLRIYDLVKDITDLII